MSDVKQQGGREWTVREAMLEARAKVNRARRLAAQQLDAQLQKALLAYADEIEKKAASLARN